MRDDETEPRPQELVPVVVGVLSAMLITGAAVFLCVLAIIACFA